MGNINSLGYAFRKTSSPEFNFIRLHKPLPHQRWFLLVWTISQQLTSDTQQGHGSRIWSNSSSKADGP